MARIIHTESFEPRTQNEADWLYNSLDVCVTLEVLQSLRPQLNNMTSATYDFSKSLQAPVLEMMMRGLLIDKRRRAEVLAQCKRDIATVVEQLTRIIRDGMGLSVGWRSTKDLKHLFYDVLGFKPIKKRNANGTFTVTVGRDAIEKLAANFRAEPLCNRLLLLRDLDKKRQRLEAVLDPDGRERTNFNIAGTETGRLASSINDFGTGGNQQNLDRDLREIYISDPGMKFANLDLEQGDSRNVGALCWERQVEKHGEQFAGAYLDACESSDLHTSVAQMVWRDKDWGVEPRKVADQIAYRNDSFRQLSKKLGHATTFDGQAPELSRRIKIPLNAVKDFQTRYFIAFPCVKERIRLVDAELLESSTLVTLFGRRRIFFGRPTDGTTKREAYAFEPQSMTAEEVNRGLLRVWEANRVWLHLQVHDSILCQYREEEENEIVPWLIEVMRERLVLAKGREFVVPIEAKVGFNWGEYSDKNPNGLIKWKGQPDNRRRA